MKRKPSGKHAFALAAVLAVALLAPLAAQANLVTDPGFDSPLTVGSLTVPTNDGFWLVASPSSWSLSNGVAVSTGGADWLIQGCTLPTTCFGPGWEVELSFDYQSVGAGQVEIVGFTAAQTWDPATGTTTGTPLTTIPLSATGSMTPFQKSFFLPQGSQGFVALGVGFNLAAGAGVSMSVDNVAMYLVAPVSFRITPNTLNLKSQGNWVTGFISNPPSCYHLADINKNTVQLTYGGGAVAAHSINAQGNKFMVKFNRGDLISLLNGKTGSVTLTVTGAFNDGIAFAGDATINVINPGKAKGPKGPK